MFLMSHVEEEEHLSDETSSINVAKTNENIVEIVRIVSVKSLQNVQNNYGQNSTITKEDAWSSKDEDDKKHNDSETTKINDDDVSLSTSDICRICHMGSFPAVTRNRSVWKWQSRGFQQNNNSPSTFNSNAYLGSLISVCKCRGTVGLVHAECLERWLTESGHTRCELCGHKYVTKKVRRYNIVRSILIWFNTVIATRQMLLDVLYLIITTPLALFSCYICVLTLKLVYENRFKDIPWTVVAMLPTCSVTLAAYWGWVLTLHRLHGRRWHRYWRNNFVIQLIPDNVVINENNENLTGNLVRGISRDTQQNYEDPSFNLSTL